MPVLDYTQFGGRHGESAAIKNILAQAHVANPLTGEPFSEVLCFGVAGGIGGGYSFCPSIPRDGNGSGVTVVGRHRWYVSDASWYQGFFDRIGATTRITETTSQAKAYQNLVEELDAGRPAIVWCSRARLPFLGNIDCPSDYWMHSFIVYGVEENKKEAYGADRAATKVTLSLDQLAEARNGVCSHKNRTLTFERPKQITAATLQTAVRDGIRACAQDLLTPKIKTFGLEGLDNWAKMITNAANKEGWLSVFQGGLLYLALRDVYRSIETEGTGGGLFRGLYADFLNEAARVTRINTLVDLSHTYRELGQKWTDLAEAALPSNVKPFKQTKEWLNKKTAFIEQQGEKASKQIANCVEKLRALETQMSGAFPLDATATTKLLEGLRERIVSLREEETEAAQRLASAVQ